METFIVDDRDALESLGEPWRALTQLSPMHSPDWYQAWWNVYGLHHRLHIVVQKDSAGRVVGLTPLYRESTRLRTRIRFLGSGNVCTDYQSPLFGESDHWDRIVTMLAYSLDQSVCRFPSWSATQIELDGIEPNAPWYIELCQLMRHCGYVVREQRCASSYVSDLGESWPEFSAKLPKGIRRKAKKAETRLESDCVFHRTVQLDELLSLLPTLERLHQSRRNSVGQVGSFADPYFREFLAEIVRRLAPRGQVEMQWCSIGDQVIAMHLVITHHQRASMYVSGIDPSALKLEPGHLLLTASIRDAISRGFKQFDFLRGDEPYKQQWCGIEKPLAKTYMTPSFAVSLAMESMFVFAEKLKHQLRTAIASPATAS